MSDESTDGAKPDERDEAVLVYDFFKFLASLALLVLGGVLNLATTATMFPANDLIVVIIVVATAGVAALAGAGEVVSARQRGLPISRSAKWAQKLSMGLLGGGLGWFLITWLNGLK